MAKKSKRFRIGVEGATTDGRTIERSWLEEMAASYDPAVYTALINMEHIKGFTPDSMFRRFGKVDSAAEMGKRFGQALADGLAMVMSPLDTLKSGVSWLLEKLGLVSEKAAAAKLPEEVAKNAPTMTKQGVQLPPGGFPMMYGGYAGYPGFAGFHDNGGYIPRGQFGVVGENGPEIVNGPANITSRRQTAALAAATGMLLGSLATPVAARPIHPLSLPVDSYQRTGPSIVSTVNHTGAPSSTHYEIHVHQAAGQSAQDTVAEVIRQLDARERQKLSRQRSSFYDQGGTDS